MWRQASIQARSQDGLSSPQTPDSEEFHAEVFGSVFYGGFEGFIGLDRVLLRFLAIYTV